MKISIILPLFDRRNAGWRSLESALSQRHPRDRYEVVAVTARDEPEMRDPAVGALLARCDAVARTDLDPSVTANEVELYRAGHRRCTGDVVFFCEGHTVLHEDCCSLIEEHFLRDPGCDIAWAPRLNHAVFRSGAWSRCTTIAISGARSRPVFSRSALTASSGEAFSMRWAGSTRVTCASARRRCFIARCSAAAVISQIRAPLATHYNDMTEELWLQLAQDSGAGRYAYYDDDARAGAGRRNPDQASGLSACEAGVGRRLARTGAARASGARSRLRTAMRALRFERRIAYRCYALALGCTDLAGYSRACAQQASQRRAKQDAASDRCASARADASAGGEQVARSRRRSDRRWPARCAWSGACAKVGQEVA